MKILGNVQNNDNNSDNNNNNNNNNNNKRFPLHLNLSINFFN